MFEMYINDRCKKKCINCAADSNHNRPELSTEQWIHIIENLEKSLQKQGRRGVYIWFGGEGGLGKYDGYSIKLYKHNPLDKKSISSNRQDNAFASR